MNLPERVDPWNELPLLPLAGAGGFWIVFGSQLLAVLAFGLIIGYIVSAFAYNALVGSVLSNSIPAADVNKSLRKWWCTPAKLELASDYEWALNDVGDFPDPDAAKAARNRYLSTWECDAEELEAALEKNFRGELPAPSRITMRTCDYCGDESGGTRRAGKYRACPDCYGFYMDDKAEWRMQQHRKKIASAYLTPPSYIGYTPSDTYPPLPKRRDWKCDCGTSNLEFDKKCYRCGMYYSDTWAGAANYYHPY